MTPSIEISPKLAIIDEKISVKIVGTEPNSPITVDCVIDYYGHIHLSFGHFFSNKDGTLLVSESTSYDGTYKGKLEMGLFTSMQPLPTKKLGGRLIVKGDASEILSFTITAWKGHLTRDQLQLFHAFPKAWPHPTTAQIPLPLGMKESFSCSSVSQRTFLSPDVIREPIEADFNGAPIRAVLFKPKGPGPFPGIVDMFGGAGGCIEFRAALFAKQGYAALATAFTNYKDLPYKTYYDVPMTYFESVVGWLCSQPFIQPGGVGMIGVSLGSQITLLSCMRDPRVKAGICLNGPSIVLSDPTFEDNPMESVYNIPNVWDISPKEGLQKLIDGKMIKNESPALPRPLVTYPHDNAILILNGACDNCVFPEQLDEIYDQLKKSGKKNVFRVVIPGEGHLLEPPYTPLCVECYGGCTLVENPKNFNLQDIIPDQCASTFRPQCQEKRKA